MIRQILRSKAAGSVAAFMVSLLYYITAVASAHFKVQIRFLAIFSPTNID